MQTLAVEVSRDRFQISTDKSKLDVPFIHHWLSTASCWAQCRNYGSFETLQNPDRWMARARKN